MTVCIWYYGGNDFNKAISSEEKHQINLDNFSMRVSNTISWLLQKMPAFRVNQSSKCMDPYNVLQIMIIHDDGRDWGSPNIDLYLFSITLRKKKSLKKNIWITLDKFCVNWNFVVCATSSYDAVYSFCVIRIQAFNLKTNNVVLSFFDSHLHGHDCNWP